MIVASILIDVLVSAIKSFFIMLLIGALHSEVPQVPAVGFGAAVAIYLILSIATDHSEYT